MLLKASLAQCVVTWHKYFLHSSLVICYFPTPLMKLGLQIGVGLVIPNHVGRINMTDQLETASNTELFIVRSYLLHSFVRVHKQCWWRAFDQPQQTVGIMLRSHNQFPELNQHVLSFLHPIFLCMIIYTRHRWRACSSVFSEWRMQIENPSDLGRPFVFPQWKQVNIKHRGIPVRREDSLKDLEVLEEGLCWSLHVSL
jgi:hypothetical protein